MAVLNIELGVNSPSAPIGLCKSTELSGKQSHEIAPDLKLKAYCLLSVVRLGTMMREELYCSH